VSLIWELMFTRSRFQTEDMIEQHHLLEEVSQLMEAGKVKSTVKLEMGTINSQNLIKAHKKVESETMMGKIVLEGF